MAGWRDDDPGLPIKFGPCSNGEYDPQPLSPVMRETVRRASEECERNAKRLGMSRREFLLSVCGAATTLLVLDACTPTPDRDSGSVRMHALLPILLDVFGSRQ